MNIDAINEINKVLNKPLYDKDRKELYAKLKKTNPSVKGLGYSLIEELGYIVERVYFGKELRHKNYIIIKRR